MTNADGVAGASARAEYERRVARRQEQVRKRHPRLGGLILALGEEPQSTRAWAVGAAGEEALGRRLDAAISSGTVVLHDRRIPRTRANIDHLVVGPSGVLVVDAKRYRGRPARRVEGGLLRPRVETLTIGGRDRTRLVEGVLHQAALVRTALGTAYADVDVRACLAFVDADWPLSGGSFTVRGVDVLSPRRLVGQVRAPGPLGPEQVTAVRDRLARGFPPA